MTRPATVTAAFLLLAVALVALSLYTGHRATALTGEPHYLFTCTHVYVAEEVPPEDETEAALDAAFAEAGEDTRQTVRHPLFVLGLVDATAPLVLLGAIILAGRHYLARRRTTALDAAGSRNASQL
ncbi:MAG: hypothetical protein DCC65_03285 [Planctomycetota bacterium]|nr:MAG: hypothetical protein DCC65_03285 [Planctomycetota bacterium]